MKELSGFTKWAHVLLVVATLIVYALLFKETCYTVIDIWEIYAKTGSINVFDVVKACIFLGLLFGISIEVEFGRAE